MGSGLTKPNAMMRADDMVDSIRGEDLQAWELIINYPARFGLQLTSCDLQLRLSIGIAWGETRLGLKIGRVAYQNELQNTGCLSEGEGYCLWMWMWMWVLWI